MATALIDQDRFISLVENFSTARASGFRGTVAADSSTFFRQPYSWRAPHLAAPSVEGKELFIRVSLVVQCRRQSRRRKLRPILQLCFGCPLQSRVPLVLW